MEKVKPKMSKNKITRHKHVKQNNHNEEDTTIPTTKSKLFSSNGVHNKEGTSVNVDEVNNGKECSQE